MRQTDWSLPGYSELKELGSGAQGRVVLARHEATGQQVAIKYLASDLLGDARARETFNREAILLQRVRSPHVAQLLSYFDTPSGAAIVMEAVPGRSLRTVLDQHSDPLAPEAALSILKGSLLGLSSAHAIGVVHRDYKPANVLVQDNGQSKLIDFGVAVLAGQNGGVTGTPTYMAPEQWAGHAATPATDVYAATCVFIECVTGERPYKAETLEGLRAQHIAAPPPCEQVPESLRLLVAKGMAKDPKARPWNANDFVAELEAIAVRTYGPDWERRGLLVLGSIAATLGVVVPATVLGASLLAPGSSAAGAGAASVGHSVIALEGGKAGAAVGGKGALAKIGGAKGAAGIGGATATAVVVAVLLWPSPPTVGGESRGTLHASFTRPGVLLGLPNMPASETPYMNLDMSVSPARARPGTTVHVTTKFRAKTLQGVKYLPDGTRQCFGERSNRTDLNRSYNFYIGDRDRASKLKDNQGWIAFYLTPTPKRRDLPDGEGVPIVTDKQVTGESQPYNRAECGFLSQWTDIRTFKLPGPKVLPPGDYMISPSVPPRFTQTQRDGKDIPPESAGGTTQGALPVVTVLE